MEIMTDRTKNARIAAEGGVVIVSASSRLVLDAIINNEATVGASVDDNSDVSWRQTAGPVLAGVPQGPQRDYLDLALGELDPILTTSSSSSFVLRSGVLIPGKTYGFAVSISTSAGAGTAAGAASQAEVRIFVNLPPTPRFISFALLASEVSGFAPTDSVGGGSTRQVPRVLIDTVTVSTPPWSDDSEHLPILYSMYLDTLGELSDLNSSSISLDEGQVDAVINRPGVVALRGPGIEPSFQTVIPKGPTENGGPQVTMTMIIIGTDALGAQGIAAARFQVRPALTA